MTVFEFGSDGTVHVVWFVVNERRLEAFSPACLCDESQYDKETRTFANDPYTFVLLMTVARILRGKVMNEIYAERDDDLAYLNKALAPFDPVPSEPVNEKPVEAIT